MSNDGCCGSKTGDNQTIYLYDSMDLRSDRLWVLLNSWKVASYLVSPFIIIFFFLLEHWKRTVIGISLMKTFIEQKHKNCYTINISKILLIKNMGAIIYEECVYVCGWWMFNKFKMFKIVRIKLVTRYLENVSINMYLQLNCPNKSKYLNPLLFLFENGLKWTY